MVSGVYAITDQHLMPEDDFCWHAESAIANGIQYLQYRDKSTQHARRLQQALFLRECCNQYGVKLIINDDIDLALDVGADGVHLGLDDGDIQTARARLGAQAIIGATCHDSLIHAQRAYEAGASYLAFGRCFPSKTKPQAPSIPLERFAQIKQQFDLPIVAIGGIRLDNLEQLPLANITLLAVVDGIFGQPDIALATRSLCERVRFHSLAT